MNAGAVKNPTTADAARNPDRQRRRHQPKEMLPEMPSTLRPLGERIRQRSQVNAAGCWIWKAKPGNRGYGHMMVRAYPGAKPACKIAHRVSYEAFVGPIPDGLDIDHLCRVRLCVNPEHLEPVTRAENQRRSPLTLAVINAAKTHCPKGHPYDESNTFLKKIKDRSRVSRNCRACSQAWSRRYYQARKQLAAAVPE